MKHLLYFNFTASEAHIGCLAVCYSHLKGLYSRGFDVTVYTRSDIKHIWTGDRLGSLHYLEKDMLANDISNCDGIIINGEGSLHHNRALYLLTVAEFAINVGKPVFLINSTLQDIDGYDDVLKRMSDIMVREQCSYHYLLSKGIESRLAVDSIVNADFIEGNPLVQLDGRMVVTDWIRHAGPFMYITTKLLKAKYQISYYPLVYRKVYRDWRSAVANIKTANIVATSRYHALYLAGLAGTPFVAFPTNSYKILGLIKSSGLPLPYCDNHRDIDNKVEYALKNPSLFSEFKDFLMQNKGRDFDGLDRFFGKDKFDHIKKQNKEISSKINKIFDNYRVKYEMMSLSHFLNEEKLCINSTYEFNKIGNYKKSEIFLSHYFNMNSDSRMLFEYGISLYGNRKFDGAIKIFSEVVNNKDVDDRLFKRALNYLFKVYIETGRFDKLNDLYNDFSYKSYSHYPCYYWFLYNHRFQEAYLVIHEHLKTLKLLDGWQRYDNDSQSKSIVIYTLGGVGDQLKTAQVFKELHIAFDHVSVLCDGRLIQAYQRAIPYFNYYDQSQEYEHLKSIPVVFDRDLLCYFPSMHDKPFSVIKADENLVKYWLKRFKNFNKKYIVGVCLGSHVIGEPERLSHVFSVNNFKQLFDYSDEVINDTLFVNIGISDIAHDSVFNPPYIDRKNDLESIFAIIECCDVIITPPNSILDVCGSLSKKVLAICTGKKFYYRYNENFIDFIHKNTQWIVTDLDKKTLAIAKCRNALIEFLISLYI